MLPNENLLAIPVGPTEIMVDKFLPYVNSITQLTQELWPMLVFLFVAGFIALKRFRQTLD
ncbi:hypothetical protein [Undibacterium flavidum]|uniref:ABC-2 type transport system permease protein n=1 Tax=Undibacterium flavidum TaxID=2762297 RepID=A0ABR6Y659_9BURK|nr:hypothetical protein [Undibacterium flavidum]MBC3872099.1 hypothetical protein [Undibacterium flavidum]